MISVVAKMIKLLESIQALWLKKNKRRSKVLPVSSTVILLIPSRISKFLWASKEALRRSLGLGTISACSNNKKSLKFF